MIIYDVINKKKQGLELDDGEIREFVGAYTRGEIPDYQAAALLMAICIKGMTERETFILTDAISRSGDTVDLSALGDTTADKHSTGGVGDKTTLIVAPLAACLGCTIAKMSGRGLGHTGGTVDKLESIPGYRTSLDSREFLLAVKKTGIAVVGQSGNLAPADKKLYALRDVTATVDSVPLIASSVMGKKLAAGAKTIVLDVKYGSGSFMKSPEDAEALARTMVALGKAAERRISAVISNMDVPLGYTVGNSIEVIEAIKTLRGDGPRDLTELSVTLASQMASLALSISKDDAEERAREALRTGAAFEKFVSWITAQGGDEAYLRDPSLLGMAKSSLCVSAVRDGYVCKMDTEKIGKAALMLGAGRRTKDDKIDPTAGITLKKKYGDKVSRGDVLAILHSSSPDTLRAAETAFLSALSFSDEAPGKQKLIYKII